MNWTAIIIWGLIFLVAAIMGIVWLLNKIIFKHTVIIRDQGNNDLVYIDNARDYIQDGVNYWKLKKERNKEWQLLPVPPKETIDIAKRGKKFVEVIRSPEGNYEYLTIDSKEFTVKQPLTSKQRMILMNNFRKANERKGTSWKEHIPLMISLGALVILVICLIIFYGEIAKPVIEARGIGLEEKQLQLEILQVLKEIKQGQQTITDNIVPGGVPN